MILFVEGMVDDQSEVLAYLKAELPSYMIQARIITMEAFPLNKNDKIDRASLRESVL